MAECYYASESEQQIEGQRKQNHDEDERSNRQVLREKQQRHERDQ
jgi:hypothetical protein